MEKEGLGEESCEGILGKLGGAAGQPRSNDRSSPTAPLRPGQGASVELWTSPFAQTFLSPLPQVLDPIFLWGLT